MKLIIENWRKFANEAKNPDGKEQGSDGKACWDGYKYAGTGNGKDKCVKMEEEQDIDAVIDEEIEAVLDEKAKKTM